MIAVVLVGGEGTRLRPLTYTVPKQMLPVGGLPLMERVVGHLSAHGVGEVVLSLGYRPDAFAAAYPDRLCAGAKLTFAVEPEPMDTAGAIAYAADAAGIRERFLALNGDVVSDLDLGALLTFHTQRGAEATIALTPVEDPSAFGVVSTHGDGRVSAFIEKPAPGTAPTNLINAGAYVLEPSVIARIPRGRRVNIERETFPQIVRDGTLFALTSRGYWIDVGTPAHYLKVNADVLAGLLGEQPAPGASALPGGSWSLGRGPARLAGVVAGSLVGEGVWVEAEAVVERSVLGAQVSVGTSAKVSGSVLLAGATVEPGAEVVDSVVGPAARIGEGAVVCDHAVLGADAVVAAGARQRGGGAACTRS